MTLLAENPDKFPQIDDASAQFINVFSPILMTCKTRSILATATWRGFAVGTLQAGDYLENGLQPLFYPRHPHRPLPATVGFTVVATDVSLQNVRNRIFYRTATNPIYIFLDTAILEQ